MFPGELKGEILSAFNIDLQRNPGTVHLSEKLIELFNSTDDAQFGNPGAFIKSNADSTNRYWVRAGVHLFKSDSGNPEAGWAQDAIGSSPTDAQDNLMEYADNMYSPSDVDVDQLSAGTWTNPWWSNLSCA